MLRTTSFAFLFAAVAAAGCLPEGDVELGTDQAALSVHQWSEDVRIQSQVSQFQVGLAPLGNRLHMLAASGSSGEIFWSQFDGAGWSNRASIGQYADYGPALTVHNGQLVTVYHRRGHNQLLMSTSSGQSWSTPVTAGTSFGAQRVRYAPAVASHGGHLYIAYCRTSLGGDIVSVERFDGGTSWTVVATYPMVASSLECKHVAMSVLPTGRLHILWTQYRDNGPGGNDFWFLFEASGDGAPSSVWPWGPLSRMRSAKPPSMVTCNGTTHMVHGGLSTPREIWWSYRDGDAWSENVRVPNQASDGGAQLGCFNGDRTVMVHNGGTTQLWWSEFED
jgi:hypothetical protein